MPGASVAARRISVDSYLKSARGFHGKSVWPRTSSRTTPRRLPGHWVTFGGSAFHDLVVRELAGRWALDNGVRIVLRSGLLYHP